METERITLSQREQDRLKVLHEVKQKLLSQVAAQRLKTTDRQVRRMLLRIRERGDSALVHVSILRKTGHLYFALTDSDIWGEVCACVLGRRNTSTTRWLKFR